MFIKFDSFSSQQPTFLDPVNKVLYVMATTRHKVQQLHKQVKFSVGNQVGKITRELDKESLLNQSPLYTKHTWSILPIIKPVLLSMLQSHICLIFQSRPPCSRPMLLYHVTCHVTVVSHASSSFKIKIKEKKKKIVSVQAFHNSTFFLGFRFQKNFFLIPPNSLTYLLILLIPFQTLF